MNNTMTYAESDVRDTVTAIIASELKISSDEVLGDASITDDLGADSLKTMGITMTIENRFRVHLQEVAARKPYTVNTIVEKLMAELS
jgi:acyl carrier protein